MSTPLKGELALRMGAMRAAGLVADDAVADDAIWRGLYNDNLSVRLAYDQDKYGRASGGSTLITSWKRPPEPPEAAIKPYTPGQDITRPPPQAQRPAPPTITPPPAPPEPPPPKVKTLMSRPLLIATARGHALHVNDDYFAWLLGELADALEADQPINLKED